MSGMIVIGRQDFEKFGKAGSFYVDKTDLGRQWREEWMFHIQIPISAVLQVRSAI